MVIILNVFELLIIAWKRERQITKLEPLESDFYDKIKPYISHLENQFNDEEDKLISSIFKKRWSRVNYLINDLITIRMDKHFKESINGVIKPEMLPEEEIKFREEIDAINGNFRNNILEFEKPSLLDEKDINGNDYQFFIFNSNDNTISIGTDFNEYGPFNKGDIVLLPKENKRNYMIRSLGNDIELN